MIEGGKDAMISSVASPTRNKVSISTKSRFTSGAGHRHDRAFLSIEVAPPKRHLVLVTLRLCS